MTLAAAKLLGGHASYGMHSAIYYALFLLATFWALVRGAPRAGVELSVLGAVAMLCVPLASLIAGADWYDAPALMLVDGVALMLAIALLWSARAARHRARTGPRDSVWSDRREPSLGARDAAPVAGEA